MVHSLQQAVGWFLRNKAQINEVSLFAVLGSACAWQWWAGLGLVADVGGRAHPRQNEPDMFAKHGGRGRARRSDHATTMPFRPCSPRRPSLAQATAGDAPVQVSNITGAEPDNKLS